MSRLLITAEDTLSEACELMRALDMALEGDENEGALRALLATIHRSVAGAQDLVVKARGGVSS
jgi:hypothetical protein